MTELKPCPFCGSEAEFEQQYHGGHVVYCQDCGCSISGDADVAKVWNTRAGNDEIAELKAQIKKLEEQKNLMNAQFITQIHHLEQQLSGKAGITLRSGTGGGLNK